MVEKMKSFEKDRQPLQSKGSISLTRSSEKKTSVVDEYSVLADNGPDA